MNGMNYVRMKYGTDDLLFLLDTGATLSVIFSKFLQSNEIIDTTKQIDIRGIAGSVKSMGLVNIPLNIYDYNITHEFVVMTDLHCGVNGIIGSDFFEKYRATIDYEKFLFSFWINSCKITINLESKIDSFVTIPPRCEIIKYFSTDASGDCVILPSEISEGVFTAGIIVRPDLNKVPVRILNTNDREVKIKNFKPGNVSLSKFELLNFESTNINLNRVNKLLDLLDIKHLNKEEIDAIHKICAKYADVFLLKDDPLSVTNIIKETIKLKKDAHPVYVKPYRLPQAQKTEIDSQITKLLNDGIIEETKSSWSSPLLIVPKKNDSQGNKQWRVVIDYRLLNKNIEDDRFPLPNITEIFDSLSGALYFTHLDLSQGYYQVELEPSSRNCTAFTTNKGQFQMTRLPMGLKTSPSSFSRVMTIAMSGLNYDSCFVYMDDLIVFGNSLQNHNKNLIKVLNRLRAVNLKLNPVKCQFLEKKMLYLGHIISADGISPDPAKINAIKNYPTPKNADECKRFVAFVNYYRRFIKNFAEIAYPLNKLCRKSMQFRWDECCQKSFEILRNSVIKPPILQYPSFSETNKFILRTDASGYAIGAVLSNSDDKPVAYASRSLNKAEINYPVIEKELLAIVWSVKHFRPYLYGRKFEIFTDHKPLIYLFSMTNPSSRLTKFRLVLEEFDFTVHYIKGKENSVADALSRITLDSTDLKNMSHDVFVTTRAQQRLKNSESVVCSGNDTDKWTGHPGIVELLKRPIGSIELRNLTNNELEKCNDVDIISYKEILYDKRHQIIYVNLSCRSISALDAKLRHLEAICINNYISQLCIFKCKENDNLIANLAKYPRIIKELHVKFNVINKGSYIDCKETRQLILNEFHILPTGGHAGINRMFNNIKRYYCWNNLKHDVAKFVNKCDECQRYKHSRSHKEPLTLTTTASSAFEKIFLDLVGPLNQDNEDNRYILTVQCELTKFVGAYPIKSKEAETVAKSFVQNFILQYGIPQEIVTDQGTEFLACVFRESARVLGIKQLHSCAYHHETLGSLENTHKSLGAYLRIQTSKFQDTWSPWVPFWAFAFNNTVHSETKYTPFELVFGKTCKLPTSLLNNNQPIYNFDDYNHELRFRLKSALDDARTNLIESKNKRKCRLDKNCKEINFKFNDKVLLKSETNNKLEAIYKGPYKVIKDEAPNIIIKINNKLITVHKNRVKKYSA